MPNTPQNQATLAYLDSGRSLPPGVPFCEAVRAGDTFYFSGQIGNTPGTLELAPGGITAEARQLMENMSATLSAHGLGLDRVVKCTVMLADMAEWKAFNEVYASYFPAGQRPARSAFGCAGLVAGARVEMEFIAVA